MDQSSLLVTIPHSGEKVPPEAHWLLNLDEVTLMYDVDRFVDRVYEPALKSLAIPFVKTEWHRYVVDLNRLPEDIDQSTVVGATEPAGKFSRGFHWAITTKREVLMPKPISMATHQDFIRKYFEPFHAEVRNRIQRLRDKGQTLYHIDAHSMPSKGTSEHRDPGELRADFVVSDVKGTSCSADFKNLVISSYERQGFKVAYNWPYFGGRITEMYGAPQNGHHAIQVEMNRALYMDENTKQAHSDKIKQLQPKIEAALKEIKENI